MASGVAQIPVDVLAIMGLVLLAVFGLLFYRARRKTAVSEDSSLTKPARPWLVRAVVYLLKLALFGIFVFLVIDLILTIYLSYETVVEELAPAHHSVTKPDGFTLPIEEISFTGGDDLTLVGWYVPPQNEAVIILLHGYGGDRAAMMWHAEQLYAAGYGLLMYDERASGESEGEQRSYGWRDPADVFGAVEYLQTKPGIDPQQIGIVGCSIGGQIALQSTAYSPDIQAVWADGSATVTSKDIPLRGGLLFWLVYPSNYVIDRMMAQKLDMKPPSALVDVIDDIAPRPIMLVAGGQPHPLFGAEAGRMEHLAGFAGENADVWVIEEATHCDGPALVPEDYATRMVAFFDDAFVHAGVSE